MGVKDEFTVLIGGGSIAGLSLANMLELYGINFLVLEAWDDIAPQVGASIGILPHGNRIFDQIGVFQKVLDLCPPLDSFHFRDNSGKIVHEFFGMNQSMIERHGYPITFLDRQMVLQVLYDNIKDKSKILTGKRVQRVDLVGDGVVVKTSDGSTYHGDLLVGADGIHSTVRQEMWRLANKSAPGWIPADEPQAVPCDYGCVFGISNPCKGIEPGASNSVFRKHESYIVNGGPEGRIYWFYFFKLAQRAYGDDIPVYSTEDERRVLAHAENHNITPTLKFKDILDRKITSVLVPLQEYVFRQWYFKRIITIGDSSHKFHPIAGHGGNAAIESAATFANALRKAITASRGSKPTLKQIERVFATTQKIRQERTVALKEHSHEQQRGESLDTSFHEFAAFHLLPRTVDEDVTFHFSRNMPLAEKLDNPKLTPVARLVPYKDELLAAPKPRGAAKWYFITLYLAIAGLVHFGMWKWSANWGLGEHLGQALETGNYTFDATFNLKRTYTGFKPLDDYLVFLAAIFIPGLKKWDQNFGMIQLYFLGMLIQPIAVWSVEAFRRRNQLTPLAFIAIWLTFVQSAGIGIYMPIYYAVYTWVSEPETYWWPLKRDVPVQYAVTLLWSNLIGYALPTLLMFIPWKDHNLVQNFESLWQPSPMFVPWLITIFGLLYAKRNNIQEYARKANKEYLDISYLKTLYIVTGAIGAVFHWYCCAKILSSTNITFVSVFLANLSSDPKSLGDGLKSLFLVDFWGFEIASYIWLCMAVWDLKRMGRTTVDVNKSSALIALASLIIGPGATMSAVWYWREGVMAQTLFSRGGLN